MGQHDRNLRCRVFWCIGVVQCVSYYNHNIAAQQLRRSQRHLRESSNINERAKIAEASWEEFGSPSLDFCVAILVAGLFAGHFVGLSPASFSPTQSPAKGTEELGNERYIILLEH